MAKQIELKFLNPEGRIVTYTLDDPIEPVDPIAVSSAMDTMIAQNVFTSTGGDLTEKKEARIVERNVVGIELA
ncbi:DUF2922 domain-containing protein [Bacillaceae bacterium S4-13-58]